MKRYDYLIVGSGLYGATFAHFARRAGKRCLVIDRRPQLGGLGRGCHLRMPAGGISVLRHVPVIEKAMAAAAE